MKISVLNHSAGAKEIAKLIGLCLRVVSRAFYNLGGLLHLYVLTVGFLYSGHQQL